jgi:hypothetical protein
MTGGPPLAHRAPGSSTWGGPQPSRRERGEEYLNQIDEAVSRCIGEVE